jgi:hypothetical protein
MIETKNSSFIKNNIFEENKKSEEFKENMKIPKVNLAYKQMIYNTDFIKQVRENFRKFTNKEFLMREQSEKSKPSGNKKKCLKIMSFRFFRKNLNQQEKNNIEEKTQNDIRNDEIIIQFLIEKIKKIHIGITRLIRKIIIK